MNNRKKVKYYRCEKTHKILSYKNVPADREGWVNAKYYLPADYDIVYIQIKDKLDTQGWINGWQWDGLKVKKNDEILYWKRC